MWLRILLKRQNKEKHLIQIFVAFFLQIIIYYAPISFLINGAQHIFLGGFKKIYLKK